ncbi:MAG: phosphate ABC transporter permease PstA [Pseudomonadales bacterium]|nr:phosphate ABC transporter permease PstA [Pseudomonadales bacterium]
MNKMSTIEKIEKGLKRRYFSERLFQIFGISSIVFGLLCLVVLLTDIVGKGHGAFFQHYIRLTVVLDAEKLGIDDRATSEQIAMADYDSVIRESLLELFPDVSGRKQKKQLYRLVSDGATYRLQGMLAEDRRLLGQRVDVWVSADDDVDVYLKHVDAEKEASSRIDEQQALWLAALQAQGRIEKRFNSEFFMTGDSRNPEKAGIKGALMGSFYTLMVTLLLSFPIGVAAAVYLEEFAPKNRWTDLIEVNINNLAAVPSIIFGLLGLAVFINFFGVPRSVPLVGGMVLTLMTLPTIIISSRAAIKSVPPSIREAALGIGASKMQTVTHHVLPLSLPGMLTGTIIGMAQALGETAPLLMIGMIAFIVDVPQGITDPSTVLPVQIFLWADSPERAFTEKTSGAIIVLLGFLIFMNAVAVFLRKRLEKKW